MKIHELKTWPECFKAILSGSKNFEVRKNDRNFRVGDRLDLMEYNPNLNDYTGRHTHRFITYILKGGEFGIEEGFCVMGLTYDYEERYNE